MRNSALNRRLADDPLLSLVGRLADPTHRALRARELAEWLGADDLRFLQVDPEIGVPLPAAGFPQTLTSASLWQQLAAAALRSGSAAGKLPNPDGHLRPTVAIGDAGSGTVAVLIGSEAGSSALESLRPVLPLLGGLFSAEQKVVAAGARVRIAEEIAASGRVAVKELHDTRKLLEAALRDADAAKFRERERAEQAEGLAEELRIQTDHLQEQASELEMLNEALSLQTAAAEEAHRRADVANRTKSEFLAKMSHELRTPINAVIGYTQLLEMGLAGPIEEGQRAHLMRIHASSSHLLMLVDDILDVSRIEAGTVVFQLEAHSAASVAEEAIAIVGPQATKRGLQVQLACEPDWRGEFLADRDRVRQILVNLLSNAIKFTSPDGRVTIRCGSKVHLPDELGAPMICFSVEDTGIGMESADFERIFEPFVQVDSAHTRVQGGSGLGLAISRQLARLMGGNITVRSEVGRGSCFTLFLPDAAAAS